MEYQLTENQIADYERDGFLSPIEVFNKHEITSLRTHFENFENHFGGIDKAASVRTDLHLLQNWAWSVINDTRIVNPISQVLGPNILLWSTQWFIKEPGDQKVVSFHQDANYWGLEPHDVVTAWLALSDASVDTGPMSFVPGSHKEELYDHTNTFAENNLLSRGQEIKRTIDKSLCKIAPLRAGEMSLHNVRTIHNSGPNESKERRIGMVLRYCATHVRQTKGSDTAVLVSGQDNHHNFQLLDRPQQDFGEKETRIHLGATQKLSKIIMS